jgi:acetate kinase
MKVLVINSGSSSIKYRLFGMEEETVLASGALERIGEGESHLKHSWIGGEDTAEEVVLTRTVADHREGLEWIFSVSAERGSIRGAEELHAIGHRVVHGGEAFRQPTLVDGKVVEVIRKLIPLAPLHNPANLLGIEVMRKRCPTVPQVAVFDTAFHQSMPSRAFLYALPHEFYAKHQVRRYGFHGTSHRYVAKQAARYLGRPLEELSLITLHLGNGASAAAVHGGGSLDTSMGMTPLEGLVMGTRCGDLDPALHFYLERSEGISGRELESLLYRKSGLEGLCGENDMREILRRAAEGDEPAEQALDVYCYRLRKYIGAYFAVLGGADAVVFTGGVGENAAPVRARACEGLEALGIAMNEEKNEAAQGDVFEVQKDGSRVKVLVIPTDEELEIARETAECIGAARE